MSLFGKILAVFNVLAGIAFVVFAGMDYSKRHGWSNSHFRHQVAIYGLPVTNNDESWRLSGRSISDDLSQKSIDELFSTVGGAGVKTQIDAVQQVQGQIKSEIDGAGDDRAKKQVIAKYLIPLAKTGDERELYEQYVLDPKQTSDILERQLTALIELATSESDQTGTKRDLEARRRAIADLLYNLSPEASQHARVMTVVGLNHYIGAADRQAANLQLMSTRLKTAIADEQATFVRNYQSLMPQLQLLNEQVKELDARLKEQQELVQKHTALRNGRQSEVTEFQKKMQAATGKSAEEMATLQGLQKQLFALQQEVASAQSSNQQLEQQLRTKETGK